MISKSKIRNRTNETNKKKKKRKERKRKREENIDLMKIDSWVVGAKSHFLVFRHRHQQSSKDKKKRKKKKKKKEKTSAVQFDNLMRRGKEEGRRDKCNPTKNTRRLILDK